MLCFGPVFRLLCRLTYALCLNFLAIIHLDGHVTGAVEKVETSFTKVKILLSLYLVSSINIITGISTLFEHIRLPFSVTVCYFSWLFVHSYVVDIIKNCGGTRDSVSVAIQTPRILSKILRCVLYIQLSSRCLDIPMEHCFSSC